VNKKPIENAAPYSPSNRGTARLQPVTAYQRPSLFSVLSETAITDASIASGNTQDLNSDFYSDSSGGDFY
jgi:hypothetical protein